MSCKMMIVDDHSIVRNGLKNWIEGAFDCQVCAMTGTSAETIEYLEKACMPDQKDSLPDLIIFDVQLKDEMSFDLIKTVSEKYPDIKTIVYSMFDTTGFILMAKESGAKGYVSKSQPEEELLEGIKKIMGGELYFKTGNTEKITKAEEVMKLLTKQQRKMYSLMLMGKNNEEISRELGIKIHSVETYVNRIYEKLNIFSREDIYALR